MLSFRVPDRQSATMKIIKTKSDTISNIVYLVTNTVGPPIADRSESACAIFESFLSEGDIFHRVC